MLLRLRRDDASREGKKKSSNTLYHGLARLEAAPKRPPEVR
jgi:hypothetical protein